MKDLAIYGGGGLGKELATMIPIVDPKGERWHFLGYFDDVKAAGSKVSHFGTVIGGIEALNNWPTPIDIIIGVGSPTGRKVIREKIKNPLVAFPNFIDPDFKIGDPEGFKIGEGNVITSGCIVTADVTIGNYNLLNGSVVVAHDDVVGDYNVFMPDVRVSGEVTIGDCNLFGGRSFIIQQTKIGNNIRLGAGSVLMTKPKDGRTYIGVPAKWFKY